jgi:hypothetical protein
MRFVRRLQQRDAARIGLIDHGAIAQHGHGRD